MQVDHARLECPGDAEGLGSRGCRCHVFFRQFRVVLRVLIERSVLLYLIEINDTRRYCNLLCMSVSVHMHSVSPILSFTFYYFIGACRYFVQK